MNEFDEMLVKKKEAQEEQTASLALQHQQEVEALREEMLGVQKKTHELQIRLEEEISTLQRRLNEEKEEMDVLQEEQLTALRQQLQEAHSYAADLEEQINTNMDEDAVEELRKQQEEEIKKLQEEQVELSDVRLEKERRKQQEEEERRLLKDFENEKELLQERHTEELKVRLEKAKVWFEEEQVELSEAKLEEATRRLQEEFEKEKEALQERHKEEVKVRLEEVKVKFEEEKVQLEEQSNESLQVVLEEEVLRLVREQQEKEAELRMHWEEETVRLQELHQEAQLQERLTLQELHQEALLQERRTLQELHQEALLQERLTLQELHQEAQLQERLTLQELHQEALLQERLTLQERSEQREARVREELERERLQLEEDYEGMLQERVEEEREKLETQREEEERRVESLMEEERSRLQEKHQEELEEERSRLQEKQQEVMEEERSRLQEKQQQLMKEVMLRHAAEREALSGEMEALREDIAQERRLQEVQSRFSGDQESVAERFQTDVLKLEQSYQEELKSLSDKQQEQELCFEEKIQEVLVNAEEQRRKMEEDEQREKERWDKEREEMELLHKQEVEELGVKNEQLQKELDDLISDAQTKELALSKQLNDLHTRLQGSLETKDELFALAEQKALDSEFLLNQTVQDFKHEREELLNIQTELEVKRNETLSMSERHIEERIELLTERGDLRVKIEELEVLLKQAAEDFELERKELQENLGETGDIHAERDALDAVVGGSENVDEKSDNEVESMPEVNQVAASEDDRKEDLNCEKVGCCSAEIGQEDPELTSSESPDTPHNSDVESEEEAVPREMSCEQVSSLEAFGGEDGEKVEALASCEEENKPQDVSEILSHEGEELNHETEVDPAEPEETDELQDAEVHYLPDKSESDWEHLTTEPPDDCAHDSDADCAEVKDRSLLKLQALYSTVTEENTLLQDKVYLLQQKTELLENLLLYNAEKVKNGHQVLEENYGLKVKVLLLMEHVKALEMKAFKMTLLQIKYDDCMCENGKLKEQNAELEKRVWSRLESGRDFQEKESLSQFFCEFEKQQEEGSSEDDLQDSCEEFEMHNSKLRRAITDLQDRSLTLNKSTQAHRSEAGRLSEENGVLRQKIAALKDEDLKEVQEELKQTMEHLKKGKTEAQTAAEAFQRRSRQLEEQNGKLSEKNSQNLSDVENLQQQLSDLLEESQRREAFTAHEKNKADRVDSLESLEKEAQVQMSAAQEKVCELDASLLSLEALQQENVCLKQQLETHRVINTGSAAAPSLSDPEALQKENEALKTQVARLRRSRIRGSLTLTATGGSEDSNSTVFLLLLFLFLLLPLFTAALPPFCSSSSAVWLLLYGRLWQENTEKGGNKKFFPNGNYDGNDSDIFKKDERQRKMKIMEERMREIELSLSNVKLLLREKVAQLKEQADVLIGNLYDENDVLLEVLEKTKQRHIILEKKNFLLEEKISSLNKIMCDLTPPPHCLTITNAFTT
ncbi:hypothetical protein F7725_008414 [Dissostichus mawsoni]|uniref:Ninein n=1 Tax=Dissostichus mawsoni TaxID=36200 RepID=A0A7J5Y8E6_DISMA|nr:hypothetical protein F7725_008414 [Dissostichus mawsoni]